MAPRQVSVSRRIAAPAATIFAFLVDPSKHPLLDGSGSVLAAREGAPTRLGLGSRFAMDMRRGLPYRVTNEVVEFEEGRLVAWRHFAGHRWRWQLEPVEDGTVVTETFDWSTSRAPRIVEAAGFPERNRSDMERTLERLETLVTGASR